MHAHNSGYRAAGTADPVAPPVRRRLVRRSAAALAMMLMAVVAAPVSASSYSLTIGTPSVSTSRVAVTVPVQVTCPALDPSYTLVSQSISVGVTQAAGKEIAHGNGFVHGTSSTGLLVACDGTPQTLEVTVLADPDGPPFKRGWMSVTASANFWAGEEAEPGCGCGFILLDEHFGSGPVDRRAR